MSNNDRPILKSQATRVGCFGPAIDMFLAFVACCFAARLMWWLIRG